MLKSKKITLIFSFILVLVLVLSACKDDNITYQNQFLDPFGIDFVTSQHQKIEIDDFRNYIKIEINETEESEIQKIIESKPFYDIAKWQSDYDITNEILNKNFTQKTPQISDGVFSIYNQVTQKTIDLDKDDLSIIDMSYYTVLIFDIQNSVLYVFDYQTS